MKKFIRVFIIVFCLFFALLAIPDSFLRSVSHYAQKVPMVMSDLTLRLAEVIEDRVGGESGQDRDLSASQDSSTQTDKDEQSSAEDSSEDSSAETKQTENKESPSEKDSSGADSKADDAASAAQAAPEDSQPDIFYYYYTRISKEERLLYDAMLSLAQTFGTEDYGSESRLLDTNPSSPEFAESYTRAYNALVRDHPEYFWIAQTKAQYECKYYLIPSFGGKYKVVLTLSDSSGEETVDDYGQNVYLKQQTRMEEVADTMLEQVDFTQSEAGIALQLHDLLIDKAWYNTQADEYDYAHTAYGALVEDSQGNPGGALCDGYALAYEYLLQKAGLTCIVVSGYAGPSEEDTEKHAWNLVKLDNDWYEVDATWDDLDFLLSPSEDGYDLFLEAVSDEDYMSRIRHYMFNLTTEQMRSFTPGDELTYVSDNGWVTLLQPSVHIRSTAEESEVTRDYVTPLAPTAEGTWYTWAMLTGHE